MQGLFAQRSAGGQAQPGGQHGAAGVGGLEDDGVAGLGEHVADEEVRALEGDRDDDRAVDELLDDVTVLVRLAGTLRGEPDARDPRLLDLARASASRRRPRPGRSPGAAGTARR